MAEKITCVSPVDGSVHASRPVASKKAIAATFAAAHAAQDRWKRRPLAERAAYCSAAVDAMVAMKDEIVPELAWQMGRPVRYGGGELRGFEERARYMIAIAEEALTTLDPGPKEGFVRYVKRDPLGVVFTIAPWVRARSAMSPPIPYEPPKITMVLPSSRARYSWSLSAAGRSAEVSWNSLSAM